MSTEIHSNGTNHHPVENLHKPREACEGCKDLTKGIQKLLSSAEINDRQLQDLGSEMQKILVPLAEENRRLREKETDLRTTIPYALELISILERQSAEITQMEQGILPFSSLEACRAVDQKEILNILKRRGIEEIGIWRGAEPNPQMHDVVRMRPTQDKKKYGLIYRLLRRGYWRRHDGLLIQAAEVEVWGPPVAI